MADLSTLLYAFLGGLLPALLWLWFFNHEDPHPEPRAALAKAFLAGMMCVPIAMGLEQIAQTLIGAKTASPLVLFSWAVIEELLKLAAAWLVALRTRVFNEPVDGLIYLVVVALGFAALENSLFLLSPLSEAAYLNTALTGSLRFIGATLVHVISSGAIGALIAGSFFRTKRIQEEALAVGITAAVVLHWGFNLLIIEAAQPTILWIFAIVWAGIVALMLAFERIKRLNPPQTYPFN